MGLPSGLDWDCAVLKLPAVLPRCGGWVHRFTVLTVHNHVHDRRVGIGMASSGQRALQQVDCTKELSAATLGVALLLEELVTPVGSI